MSIPQGGGKTTISNCLESAMACLNIKTGVISYDDIYHTHENLEKIKRENPGNLFFEGRGVAGTHDIDLGVKFIN